jgi:sulfoxide reductase heme-binding subunit YedZ
VARALKPLVLTLALVPAAWLVWQTYLAWFGFPNALGADPVEKVQQDTGVWAVRMLAASLAVTPARRVLGWGWALQYRRMLGLLAFFYASLHLTNFIVLDHFFAWGDVGEDIFERPWITIGMAAWVLLLPLALTSTKWSIRRLGSRRWNALHRLVYIAAAGVVIHFFLAMKKDLREPLVYAAVIGGLLLVRLLVAARERAARGAAARAAQV